MKKKEVSPAERRSAYQKLIDRRTASEHALGSEQRRSLEGLRFGALMKQMQALQAIQGLQELAPGKTPKGGRFNIATDREERARQRQWLEFKADWLQAMLDATLDDLDRLYRFETETAREKGSAGETSPSPPVVKEKP